MTESKTVPWTLEWISKIFGPDFISAELSSKQEFTVHVYPASIPRILTILKDRCDCMMGQLVDIIAIDYLNHKNRFHLIYHMLSHHFNRRIFIRIEIEESMIIPTVSYVFTNANWYEREIWDLFGIHFFSHPGLRRILTDYTFSGHPLRKDFPLTGYTEVYYDERIQKVEYRSYQANTPYREFDFLSPWDGPKSKWAPLMDQENTLKEMFKTMEASPFVFDSQTHKDT